MDILVIGSGGREHALAWRLARDEGVRRVRVAPGNGGTAAAGENIADLDVGDPLAVARHATRERYDLVVIGPEAPLAAGVADELTSARIPVFGPSRAAARLESSKAFAKRQMERAGVATASAQSFTDPGGGARPRACGGAAAGREGRLAGGRQGRRRARDRTRRRKRRSATCSPPSRPARRSCSRSGCSVSRSVPSRSSATRPSSRWRPPVTTSGSATATLGPNTGGMGAYTPVPWFGADALERAAAEVFEPIAWQMERDRLAVPRRALRRPDADR